MPPCHWANKKDILDMLDTAVVCVQRKLVLIQQLKYSLWTQNSRHLTLTERRGPHLDSHVGVSEDHVEVIVRHAKLIPQLCDQLLVHHVLLTKTLHWLVIFWNKRKNERSPHYNAQT